MPLNRQGATQVMLASLYHAHHSRYVEDLPFWHSLAAQQGDPVLELGCGTGRVALRLALEGHRVYGLDWDAGMLAVFRAQLATQPGLPVELLQVDVVDFGLAAQAPLVIMPCNTFSTFPDEDRLALLQNIRATLQDEGIFVVSMPNPGLLAGLPDGEESELQIEDTFFLPTTGYPVQVSSAWQRIGERLMVRWAYDQLFPDGGVERTENVVQHFIRSLDGYRVDFASAGFSLDRTYGDYAQAPYTSDSPYLILVARAV